MMNLCACADTMPIGMEVEDKKCTHSVAIVTGKSSHCDRFSPRDTLEPKHISQCSYPLTNS